MTTLYLEWQHDPRRRQVTMAMSTGFAGDRHTVVRDAADDESARAEVVAFVNLYRKVGAEVVTNTGKHLPAFDSAVEVSA